MHPLTVLEKYIGDLDAPVWSLIRATLLQQDRYHVQSVQQGDGAECRAHEVGDCVESSSLNEAVQHGTAVWEK